MCLPHPAIPSHPPTRLIYRRHHGAPNITTTVSDPRGGRRKIADANTPPEGGEAEGAVRGGQLFGHLAGRGGGGESAGSGGYGSGDDGSDHFVGMMRADSGGSELPFGMELSGVRVGVKSWSCAAYWGPCRWLIFGRWMNLPCCGVVSQAKKNPYLNLTQRRKTSSRRLCPTSVLRRREKESGVHTLPPLFADLGHHEAQ